MDIEALLSEVILSLNNIEEVISKLKSEVPQFEKYLAPLPFGWNCNNLNEVLEILKKH